MKRGRKAINGIPWSFIIPTDLYDYIYDVMRARRLLSMAGALREVISEHRASFAKQITNTEN